MNATLKRILCVIAGFVAASAVMMLNEFINGHVWYPELGAAAAGVTDPAAIGALMASAPVGALVVVLIGWALGGFVGGWTATRLAGAASSGPAAAVAVLLTLAVVANNLMIPPPLWFRVVGLLATGPLALLGGRIARSAARA